MKRLIIIFSLLFVSFFSFAQGGPIKFLGIPVDGSESQFVSKLKSKGFRYDSLSESYKGQFNGQNVDVLIHTNHNLVDRVMVAFSRKSEQDIIHEFNNLLSQFQESDKYLDLSINEENKYPLEINVYGALDSNLSISTTINGIPTLKV